MTDTVEDGAALAWRLLATLEGGSLVLVTSALLAYSARHKLIERTRKRRPVKRVLVTNIEDALGRQLKKQLELNGCTVTSAVTNETGEDAGSVDALVVVGAELKEYNVESMANLVSQDVYTNLKILETLSRHVRPGGRLAWACAGASSASTTFNSAADAYDAVLLASLRYIANNCCCEPVWVGRCEETVRAAELIVAALLPKAAQQTSTFSLGNAVFKVAEYFCRRLKIIQ